MWQLTLIAEVAVRWRPIPTRKREKEEEPADLILLELEQLRAALTRVAWSGKKSKKEG
jgi:hypothetical protein